MMRQYHQQPIHRRALSFVSTDLERPMYDCAALKMEPPSWGDDLASDEEDPS